MFRRHSILIALVVASACDASRSTAPRGPEGKAADKQGTTSSQLLLHMPVDDGNQGEQAEIFRMDADGTNLVRLTYELGTAEYQASWAPDGKRVLFVRDYYDHSVICVMNADGTAVTQLTSTPGTELDQFPIAFGKQIAFIRYEAGSTWIYIMNADGTGLTRLSQTAAGTYPAPSPRGGKVAFARNGDIYLLDVTTGGLTNLTNSPEYEQEPAYSPSGKQITFVRGSGDGGVFVMNDDGTLITRVTTEGPNANDHYPRWSPDGKRIAFTSDRDGSNGIYVINVDGTGLTDLTRSPSTQEYLSAWARQ